MKRTTMILASALVLWMACGSSANAEGCMYQPPVRKSFLYRQTVRKPLEKYYGTTETEKGKKQINPPDASKDSGVMKTLYYIDKVLRYTDWTGTIVR